MSESTISRRGFVGATAATVFAAAANAAQPAPRVPIVDAHLHCFAGRNDKRFPYHERAPYRPDEIATPEHLLKLMDAAGTTVLAIQDRHPFHIQTSAGVITTRAVVNTTGRWSNLTEKPATPPSSNGHSADAPAKWIDRMAKSIAGPGEPVVDKGG